MTKERWTAFGVGAVCGMYVRYWCSAFFSPFIGFYHGIAGRFDSEDDTMPFGFCHRRQQD